MKRFFAILIITAFPLAAQAFDPFAIAADETASSRLSESELVSTVSAIAPGEPFTVALKLTHPEGWHSYFHNDGIGISKVPTFTWTLPAGFDHGEIRWPAPHRAEFVGLKTYGYEGTNYLPVTITPPADLPMGREVTISLEASWQTCKESCVDESGSYALTFPVKEISEPNRQVQAAFDGYARSHLPGTAVPESWSVSATDSGSSIVLRIEGAGDLPEELFFFDHDGQIDPQAEQEWSVAEDGAWLLAVARNKGNMISDEPGPVLDRLYGILSAPDDLPGMERPAVWITAEFGDAPPAAPVGFGKLLTILGGMFLGGLILNLMPCVFPVIGIKIMGFVQQAGEDRRKIALHGLLFVLGVVVSFGVLAGLLLAVREGAIQGESGGEIGWGYQLQNPWVVWGLLLVMFLLALNLFGLFEIGTKATSIGGNLARKQGALGTFFSGVLATIVATPCSAPFLGAAIGAAFTFPPVTFMLAFTFMALGLAAPYLLLSLFPQLVQKLPRPGPWMESFKQAMSFLLFATAGFLLWVYAGQIEFGHVLNVVVGLTAIAVAAWVYGRWCPMAKPGRTRTIGGMVALVFLVVGLLGTKPPRKDLLWMEWSPDKVENALADGRPVYVDFTATWCVTCQINKKTAYTSEVKEIVKAYDVLLLKADKTNPNPEIDRAVRELGRAAIPVNVLHVPGHDEPHITRELLTGAYLEEFLISHLGQAGATGVDGDTGGSP